MIALSADLFGKGIQHNGRAVIRHVSDFGPLKLIVQREEERCFMATYFNLFPKPGKKGFQHIRTFLYTATQTEKRILFEHSLNRRKKLVSFFLCQAGAALQQLILTASRIAVNRMKP